LNPRLRRATLGLDLSPEGKNGDQNDQTRQSLLKPLRTTITNADGFQKKHSKFTGDKATISRKIVGKFSAFDGYSEGTNLS